MIKFSSYRQVNENVTNGVVNQQKIAVYATGRMNPPTKGHQHLVDTVIKTAAEFDGDAFLFPTKTFDGFGSTYVSKGVTKVRTIKDPSKIKNPLRPDIKLQYIRELLHQPNITIALETHALSALLRLHEMGYTNIVYLAGGDYFDGIPNDTRLITLVLPEQAEKLGIGFAAQNVGTRNDSGIGVSGYKASYAREAALANDIGAFRAKTGWMGEVAERLMKAVRQGMGV